MRCMSERTDRIERFVDFDVISENWSAYELEDDTLIRTKNVLMDIIEAGPAVEKGSEFGVGAKLLNVVHSPSSLRGPKGKATEVKELEKFIVQPNMKFRQIKDGGPAKYETKNSTITLVTRVRRIEKTSKFDAKGMPAYIIRTENQILVEKKTETENI